VNTTISAEKNRTKPSEPRQCAQSIIFALTDEL
jgi:hypothetical protein